jgi:hypothetical protein
MHQSGGSLTKRGENKRSPSYQTQPSESEAEIEGMLLDLVEIIISGLPVSPKENADSLLTTTKTHVERDSFRAGLSFANQPSFDSDVQ